jgi:hypothetical protein
VENLICLETTNGNPNSGDSLSCFFKEHEASKLCGNSVSHGGKHHHHHDHDHWLDSPTWALAFLRSFYQLKSPAIASSDFMRRVFSRVGLSTPCPTPGYPAGPMFSVRVVSLSRLVPILKRQDIAFCPYMT